jgi:hypothetical protein
MHQLTPRVLCAVSAVSISLLGAASAQAQESQEDRIAFSRYDPELGGFALWSVRPDGTRERRITPGQAYFADWSPDRSRLLFDFPDDAGDEQIAAIGAGGRGFQQLTQMPGISEAAEYTPNGRRIVFNRSPQLPDDPAFFTSLWIMRADGSHPRPLFEPDPAKFDVEPSVSPDGRRVLFTRLGEVDGQFAKSVRVVNMDGTHDREVTPMTAGLEHPQWSPDGRIVYEIDELSDVPHPTNGIWTTTLRGHADLVIASTEDVAYLKPQYNQRGDRIVVTCVDKIVEQTDLCVLRADGRRVRNISNSPDEYESWPTW